jgi:hypothetical protein
LFYFDDGLTYRFRDQNEKICIKYSFSQDGKLSVALTENKDFSYYEMA